MSILRHATTKSVDRIAGFELFKVAPRWLLLRMETEKGYVGWGEPNLEGWSDTVAAAVKEIMPSVIGQDPSRIQYIWQKVYRQKFYSNGPIILSALSGIDQALWDIKGKTLQAPIHDLLGGAVREKMLVYRWCGGDDNCPEDAAAEAKAAIDGTNYRCLKMNATPRMGYIDSPMGDQQSVVQASVERMASVREAVGPDIGIGLDFHGRVKVPLAKQIMAALQPYKPMFFEEPVSAAHTDALPQLAASTTIPLATGERMYTIDQFRDLLNTRGVAIIQPDCSHVGGISSLLTMARMAEAYDVALAPHCPLGPVSLAACLQVDACAINFAFQVEGGCCVRVGG